MQNKNNIRIKRESSKRLGQIAQKDPTYQLLGPSLIKKSLELTSCKIGIHL